MKKTPLIGAALALVVGGMAGCNGGDKPAGDNKAGGGEAAKGGETTKSGALAVKGDSDIIPVGGSYSKGPADALVTIVEFSEFQCPFCSRVNPTVKAITDKYGDKVRVVFKHNPLSFHKDAPLASQYALAAGAQGKFWEMHDKLFENQRAIQPADLDKYAGELGLNLDQLKKDANGEAIKKAIADDMALATKVGARGTPNFLINGKQLSGAQPLDRFTALIDEELKAAEAEAAKGTAKTEVYAARVKENFKAPAAADAGDGGGTDKTVYKIPAGNSYAKGPDDALVTVIEFSEFQCPFCSRVLPTTKQIHETYGKDVRVVFKHNPLPFHKEAPGASLAALAAGEQGKFWEMHDKLFENQRAIQPADLEKYAGEIGLDVAKFKTDMESDKLKAVIADDQKLAAQFGANGTPNFFINGRQLVGARPFESFKEVIDEELKKAKALEAAGTPRKDIYAAVTKDGKDKAAAPAPRQAPAEDTTVYKVPVASGDAIKGSGDALVTIVEFSEFQCPFCSRVTPTLKQITDKYGDKVRVVFKHNPLPFHKDAPLASQFALAAGKQGKFWEFHDKLFENQRALTPADLEKYAGELNLNVDQLKKDAESEEVKKQVQADMDLARSIGAGGTPNFFINGRKLVGAQPFASFEKLIDEQIKTAEALVAKGTAKNALYDTIIKDGATKPAPAAAAPAAAQEDDSKVYPVAINSADFFKGPANAPITIVEFSEFQCPFCSRVNPTMKEVQDKYGDKVKIVFKHNPLSFHQDAPLASEAALAAGAQGTDKFWAMHDLMFQNQRALKRPELEKYAQEAGLNLDKFKADLDSGKFKAQVQADMAEAQKHGASGTPTFFINGRKVRGAQPFASFQRVIDEELKKAGK